MDNSRNVESEPSVTEPRLKVVINQVTSPNFWAKSYWILLFCLGLAICLGIAIFGYDELSYVENSPQDEASSTLQSEQSESDIDSSSETPEPVVKPSNEDNSSILWIVGAIASGCVTSGLIIFRLRKRSQSVSKASNEDGVNYLD